MESFGSLASCSHLLYLVRSTPSISASSDCVRLFKSRRFLSLLPSITFTTVHHPIWDSAYDEYYNGIRHTPRSNCFLSAPTGARHGLFACDETVSAGTYKTLGYGNLTLPAEDLKTKSSVLFCDTVSHTETGKNFRIPMQISGAFKTKRPRDLFLRPVKRPAAGGRFTE